MTNPDETTTLGTRLEAVLKRLEVGNTEFPGACVACLQDVATAGHLPSCCLAGALWRRSGRGGLDPSPLVKGDYLDREAGGSPPQ